MLPDGWGCSSPQRSSSISQRADTFKTWPPKKTTPVKKGGRAPSKTSAWIPTFLSAVEMIAQSKKKFCGGSSSNICEVSL
jgi:hypothetical protein